MKTRKKIVQIKIVSVILFCFLYQPVFSQEQISFLDLLSEKFVRYCELYPREELYVHTDREEYIAGEKIWFEMYLFDRQSASLSSNSSVAYFEILNCENRPVVQKRIKLEQGTGQGTADLPDTLSSGNYILRAYTNRMKNFMPDNCFARDKYLQCSQFRRF